MVSVEANVDGCEGEGPVLALGWLEVDGADHQQVAHPLKAIAQLSYRYSCIFFTASITVFLSGACKRRFGAAR